MPELPEVETVVRTLNRSIKGQVITNVQVDYPKLLKNIGSISEFKAQLEHQPIHNVTRRGKYLIFAIGDFYLVNHLRMEGKWFFEPIETLYDHKHVLLQIELDDGNVLRFHDTRRFGTLDLRDRDTVMTTNPLAKLGPEPFSDEFTSAWLMAKAKNKNVAIKTFLLDQTVVVGVGNIYASEICFYAAIRPEKPVKFLDYDDWDTIVAGTRSILAEAIQHGGTTVSTFESSKNVHGMYFEQLKVYGRKGQPCLECQTPIAKIKLNQRGTYYCGYCQKF
jgi:formamidopyrimidine-DNA glycosylase